MCVVGVASVFRRRLGLSPTLTPLLPWFAPQGWGPLDPMTIGRQVAIQKLFADLELNRRGKAKAGPRSEFVSTRVRNLARKSDRGGRAGRQGLNREWGKLVTVWQETELSSQGNRQKKRVSLLLLSRLWCFEMSTTLSSSRSMFAHRTNHTEGKHCQSRCLLPWISVPCWHQGGPPSRPPAWWMASRGSPTRDEWQHRGVDKSPGGLTLRRLAETELRFLYEIFQNRSIFHVLGVSVNRSTC